MLKGFDERINGGIARVSRGHQVNESDTAQTQIGLDIGRFDAVASQPVGLPEDHTEGMLTAGFFALVTVIDMPETATQIEEHLL
ncbi:MAG: hypothetical protein RIC84_13280 [Aggregatilineales bacterium]